MGLMKCCKYLPGKAQARQQYLCPEHGPSATWSSGIKRISLAAQEAPFCLVLKKRGFEGPKTAAQKPASLWMVFLIQFRNLVT